MKKTILILMILVLALTTAVSAWGFSPKAMSFRADGTSFHHDNVFLDGKEMIASPHYPQLNIYFSDDARKVQGGVYMRGVTNDDARTPFSYNIKIHRHIEQLELPTYTWGVKHRLAGRVTYWMKGQRPISFYTNNITLRFYEDPTFSEDPFFYLELNDPNCPNLMLDYVTGDRLK